ncbi:MULTISPECIES: ankyrin repeat domain-containing protein [Burkholderia]|uniref:ankyrin repeat domain-containing protein n=1 Tax=Burkholderia TaxID=32008 RepID=UPI000D005B69|nr:MULTISPECIES: ankyrin repeat domain-containing protein [Burkholderia]MDN7542539.1 ankyrin repeat domain-containing protein [Burkholderia cenocepacia]PRE81347.1 hypothetical protein C6Q13_25175 [Burkholderia gladioli]
MSTETSTTEDAANNASTLPPEAIQNYKDLLAAIRSEDLDGVRAACERYPDVVKIEKSNGRQALHVAALSGHQAIVDELIARGSDVVAEVEVQQKDGKGPVYVTPHDLAVNMGHVDAANSLNAAIEQQMPNDPDFRYRVLLIAAERGDMNRVESIVTMDPEITKRQYGESWTPFLRAVENDQTDVVVYLLNHGANLYECVQDGDSSFNAFDLAADLPNSEIPYVLRRLKERLDEAGNDGAQVLARTQEDVRKRYETLLDAIRAQDLDGVRLACLDEPGVVTFAESDGQHALHVAASVGHRGIVEELIAHGADALAEVGTVRKYDDSSVNALPVDLAAREGHADVVELLNKTIDEQISADPDFRYRALTLAAERGAMGEVERIVKMDPALVKRQDAQDWTPFLLAVSNGHTDVVVHLLNEGADLGQWVRDDPKFFTPFDLADSLVNSEIPYILRKARARLEGEQED